MCNRRVILLVYASSLITHAQTPLLRREYINLGSRVIASEETAAPASGTVYVDVWPGTASLGPSQSMRFNPAVTGTSNQSVTWSVSPAIGTVSSAGVYTSPPTVPVGATVTIRASSVADPAKSGTSVITFYSPAISGDYPLMGSFLNFYRNLGQNQWGIEFDRMRQIGMNTIVIVSVGALRPHVPDPLGYSLSGEGLLYPSQHATPDVRPTVDRLEWILSLADQRNMKVYVGSLQTAGDWSTGEEFIALREYNKRVAQEIVTMYGHHPSLEGWYFTQELWMNWAKYHGPTYYGTALLRDFVTDMATVDITKPVAAAVVFKKDGYWSMPGLTPTELQSTAASFLQGSGLQILMPQDGGGAEAGAPPIAELPAYFQALKNAADGSAAGTALWSTVETFTQVPNVSNDRYPPGSATRIQQQVNQVRPYVTGLVNWIYGSDISEQATYYPVEAANLDREYRYRFRPASVPDTRAFPINAYTSTPAPSVSYPDGGGELSNRTGGGLNGYTLTEWAGYPVELTNGVVRVTADLGASTSIRGVRALSLSMLNSGIYHPSGMTVETSNDGVSFTVAGSATTAWPNTTDYSVGWTEVGMTRTARYVRCSFAHISWMFLSEIEVIGPPGAPPPPPGSVGIQVDPVAVSLQANQTQLFTAMVTGTPNTAATWNLTPAVGTIGAAGLYTAPGTIAVAQSVTVQAASVADPSKVASATVTLSPTATQTDMVGPVNPDNGNGGAQIFRFEARARSGVLDWAQFLMNATLNPTNACLVYFDPPSNQVFLSGDDSLPQSNTWVGSTVLGPGGTTISNSQCSVNGANSSSETTAASATVNLSITFLPGWSGYKAIYMSASDSAGNIAQWPYLGYWIVP